MSYLNDLGLKHGTDKAYWHSYCDFYDQKLNNKRLHILNVLELGIFNGSSLRMWKEYFPFANIYSIDINSEYLFQEERINTYVCSQIDFPKIDELFQNKRFELIVDDAGHTPEYQIQSFKHLFQNYLISGGTYIIEDLHTSFPNIWDDCKLNIDGKISTFSALNYLNSDILSDSIMNEIKSIEIRYSKSGSGDISCTSVITKN